MEDLPFTQQELDAASELTAVAVALFGDASSATDAVLFALDEGYGGVQIVEALRAGALTGDGDVPGVEPEFASTDLVLGFRHVEPEPLPVEALRGGLDEIFDEIYPNAPGGTGGTNGAMMLLAMVSAGYEPQGIIEALIFGIEFEWIECGPDEEQPALRVGRTIYPPAYEYDVGNPRLAPTGCGEPYDVAATGASTDASADADISQQVEASTPAEVNDGGSGSGGLLPNPLIPGPDGSMKRESIVLTVEGDSASLEVDIAFRFGVSYEADVLLCAEDFVWTGGGSDLMVDGNIVTGSIELTSRYEAGISCPDASQDDIGVPYTVGVNGAIEGNVLTGTFIVEAIEIGFLARVDR